MSFPLEMTRDSGSGPVSLEIGPLERRYAPLRVCDAGRQNRLAASMLAHGQQTPVLVVPGAAGRYVLIDGYARVAALESMSRDLVDALVLSGTETQALVLAYRMETGRRRTALWKKPGCCASSSARTSTSTRRVCPMFCVRSG